MATSGITIPLQAKIEGWQAELKRIQAQAAKVDVGSQFGRNLSRTISILEKQIDSMSKNLTQRLTSDVSIDRFNDKLDDMEHRFQDVGNILSQVSFEDLNVEYVDTEIKELTERITNLKNELNSSMDQGFQGALTGATQLEKALKRVNIDPKQLNFEEIKTNLEVTIDSAKQHVQELNTEVQNLNNSLKVAQQAKDEYNNMQLLQEKDFGKVASSIISKNAEDYGFEQIINKEALTRIQTRLEEQINKIKLSEEKRNQIKEYLNDLVPESSVATIRERMWQIQQELSGKSGLNDFGLGANNFKNYLDEIITQISDTSVFNNALDNIRQSFLNLGIKEEDINSFMEPIKNALQNQDFSKAISVATTNLTKLQSVYQEKSNEIAKTVEELQQKIAQNSSDFSKTNWTRSMAEKGLAEYENIIKNLEQQNKTKQDTIDRLEKELANKRETMVNDVRQAGSSVQSGANSRLKENINDARIYKTELEQVQAREQMIGKMQGVVQRWFSIYAAVHMVDKAIRSIISTTQELDKTITNIAIVTDKTQSDLWKQMPQYTDIARRYAASISGTYEVSQLYYQQGLGQDDVMALTEQTLKMARISGLDYADATDYMTNAVRSFKMEMQDASKVVDVYSSIAASSATSVTELASAMSKTASSAQAVGSSFENTTAMMAVMIEATRESAENIGSAMKSIISRYGEMTSEPSKLVDSEGEEMSLNRVDKALQTVGISIHNAAGEFRNFDEVIMELAKNWDTIDTNTQRYIATIMAGNRQQSRFLALVSSYDRLKELSAEAANSEDASQLQYLKTLDSIEAKTQQLQTSLQSLYINTGLEEAYKGILDVGNRIITTFSEMPRIFNQPIPAILKIGMTFYSVANSIATIFGLIKFRLTNTIKTLSGETVQTTTQAENSETQILEQQIAARMALIDRYYTYREQRANGASAKEAAQFAVDNQKQNAAMMAQSQALLLGNNGNQPASQGSKFFSKANFAKGTQGAAIAGLVSNMLGSVVTMVASSIGTRTSQERWGKGLMTIAGGGLQGAGLGFQVAGLKGAIVGGIIGALTSAFEGISTIVETSAERLKRLKEEATEANNTRIEKTAKYNDLKNEIAQLKELDKAYNDSEEAKAAYYEQSNALAEQYPQIVESYDAEGNAIIKLASAYEILKAAQADAHEATAETNDRNIKVAKEEQRQAEYDYSAAELFNRADMFSNEDLFVQSMPIESDNKYFEEINKLFGKNQKVNFSEILKSIYSDELVENEDGLLSTIMYQSATMLRQDTLKDIFLSPQKTEDLEEEIAQVQDESQRAILKWFVQQMKEVAGFVVPEEGKYQAAESKTEQAYKTAVADETQWRMQKLQTSAYYENGTDATFLEKFNSIGTIINGIIYDMCEKAAEAAEKDRKEFSTKDWFNSNEVNKKYTELFENLRSFWNGLEPEKQEKFNNLIQNRGRMTVAQFAKELSQIKNPQDNPWMSELLNFYKDSFDYKKLQNSLEKRTQDKANNVELDKVISEQKSGLEQLGAIELENILSLYDDLNKYIASSTLSESDASSIFSNYIQSFKGQTEEVQKILTDLDIFSFTDISEAISKLTSEEFNLSEDSDTIKALQAMLHLIPINLNTEIETLLANFTKGLDDFEKSVSNNTKGMNFKTMTEEMNKLGLEFKDFTFKNGKYYISDYIKLSEQLIKDQNNTFEGLKNELQQRRNKDYSEGADAATLAKEFGTTEDEIKEYQEKYLNRVDTDTRTFSQYYFDQKIEELTNSAGEATKYANDLLARSALESGRLEDFAKLAAGVDKDNKWIWDSMSSDDQTAIINAIGSGDISSLTEKQRAYYEQYSALITSNYGNIQETIASSLFSALNGGSATIKVTQNNIKELQRLQKKGWIKDGDLKVDENATIAIEALTASEEEFMSYLMAHIDTESEKLKAIKDRHAAKYSNTAIEALDQIADKQEFSYDDYIDYLSSTGLTAEELTDTKIKELLETQGLVLTAAGKVAVNNINEWIKSQRDTIKNLPKNATLQEKNEAYANLDKSQNYLKAQRAEAAKKIVQNYQSFSSDDLEEFATAFGKNFETLKRQITTSNGDGTYRLNISEIQKLLQSENISQATRDTLNALLMNISDDYLNNIKSATDLTIKGTTKQSEMQTFVNDFNMKLSTKYKIEDLFGWDKLLDQFTLKPEYFQQYIKAQQAALAADGFNESFIKDWTQSQIEQIQKNVDITSYISAEDHSTDSIARKTLENSLRTSLLAQADMLSENYSEYLTAEEAIYGKGTYAAIESARFKLRQAKQNNEQKKQQIEQDINNIITNVDKGGQDAIDALKASLPDKDFSQSEIEAAYRAQIAPLSELADILPNLEAGSVVAANQIDALNKIAGFKVNADGVVESVGKLTHAYRSIYVQMKSTGEATISELNKVVGNLLDNKDGEQQAIDALSNATNMTYSQLAEIYTQAGKELTESMVTDMRRTGIIKALGGNKMMIADFERFAEQMGWSADSEEYINALTAYRDGIIAYDKQLGDNIKANFDAISNAKIGDKINLTQLLSKYPEFEAELESIFGEGLIENGILTIRDALTLPQLAVAIGNKAVQEGGMLAEELEAFVASIHDNILNGITGAFGYSTSGTNSIASMQAFAQEYNTLTGENKDYSELFGYDTLFDTFKLSGEAYQRYFNVQKIQLEQMGLSGDAINEYIKDQTTKTLQQNFSIDTFLNSINTNKYSEERGKLIQQIQDIWTAQGSSISEYMASRYVDQIEQGGQAAVNALKIIQGKDNVTPEQLEAAYNSQINKLADVLGQVEDLVAGEFVGTEGKLYEVLARAGAVDDNGVVKAGFDMVDVYAAIYAEMTQTAGATTAGLNDAYAQLLTAQDQTNIDITEALKNGNGMSYADFGNLLAKYDIKFEDYMTQHYDAVMRDGFGNIRITDWNAFAKSIWGDNLDQVKNTQEYISAFKAYNDGLIELNKNTEKAIADEVKQIENAKAGDWINLSELGTQYYKALAKSTDWHDYIKPGQYQGQAQAMAEEAAKNNAQIFDNLNSQLHQWGASFEDGILKIGDNANLLGIAQTLEQAAADAGLEIGNGLEEVKDAILNILKSYAEAITKGISGGLTNTEMSNLITKAKDFGVTDLQFNETAGGFQLAETSAIKLYQALKSIDSLHAEEAFNALSESLEKSNENFKTTEALMAHVAKISKGIYAADDKISNARKEQYEAELAIAEEILAVRSTTEDTSFNFMDQKIPSGQNNPLNYWKGWEKAFDAINKAKKTKRMDYTDFYNMITEMGHLSEMMGGEGIQIGKNLEVNSKNYTDLITKAAENLTTTAKDTNLKVNLPSINVDFSSAKDMVKDIDKGIDAIAKEQISMLDGMIALLETVVAMEKLNDITAGGEDDTKIDLGDIFPEITWNENDLPTGGIKYAEDYKKIVDEILALATDNKDLAKGLKNTKLRNGKESFSLEQIFGMTPDKLASQGKEFVQAYSALLEGFRQAAISGNYDENDVFASIKRVLAESGINDLTLEGEKSTIFIKSGVITQVRWEDPDVQSVLEELGGDTEEAREKISQAMDSYLNGEGTGDLELEYILRIRHHVKVDPETKEKYVEVLNDKFYEGKEGWKAALAEKQLEDMGIDPHKLTKEEIDGGYAETTTTIGTKNDIKVRAKKGKATYEGDFGEIGHISAANPQKLQQEIIKKWKDYYSENLSSDETGKNKATYTDEQIIYQTLGIRAQVSSTIVDDKGKAINPAGDPALRKELQDYANNSLEAGDFKPTGDGNYTFTVGKMTYTISGAAIETPDGKGIDTAKAKEAILKATGLDIGLKETISAAITESLSALPQAINSIEPTKITSVSEALSGITTALAAVVGDTNWDTLIAKLGEVASAASGIKLPTGGNGNEPETPTPSNKSKLPLSPKDIDKRLLIASSSGLSSLSSDAKDAILENQGEAGEGAQQVIEEVNTVLTAGQQTLTTTSTNTGTAVTESFASAMTNSLSTLSKGITEAVESVDKSYTELETRTEQVAGSIRSHWDALVNQITAAVTLIRSLVQSLQEKISITWTIGSKDGKSDLAGSGSGVNKDLTRGVTALTEYMDKMLSTMEHNKKNDTFKVTMPTLTIDTSTTKVNIDDIGTKVQEEAAKEPVKEVKVSVGSIAADLTNVNIDIADVNEKVKTEVTANPISSLDTSVDSIIPDLTSTTVDTAGINTKVQTEVTNNSISNLDTSVDSITPDLSSTTVDTTGINTKVQTEVTNNPISNLDIAISAITPDISNATLADVDVFTEPLTIKSANAKIEKLADPLDLTTIHNLGQQSLPSDAFMTISDGVKAVPTSLSLSLGDTSNVSIDESTPVVLSEPIKVPAEVDTTDAETNISNLKTQIGEIKQESTPKILVDINPAIRILNALYKAIDEIKQKKIPQITVDTEVAKNSLNEIIDILNTIIEKAQSLIIAIGTAEETNRTSKLIEVIMNNLITIEGKKNQTITISGGGWDKLISDLQKIAKALAQIQGASGINIDINGGPKETPEKGKTPEEGETPKEEETPSENKPSTNEQRSSGKESKIEEGGEVEVTATATSFDPGAAAGSDLPVNAEGESFDPGAAEGENVGVNVEGESFDAGAADGATVNVNAEAASFDPPAATPSMKVDVQASGNSDITTESTEATITYNLETNGDEPRAGGDEQITYNLTKHGSEPMGGGTFDVTYRIHTIGGLRPFATGNIGLAKAAGTPTLMGELGPELVVSNGRYFVAGQNGAEMVNLGKDAIVFNHLQTEQLLKNGMSNGRGRAVTNERNAVAFAKGNVDGGPAMASASAALAALKQIRSMWQSLLNASVKDLAGAGGSGGGGGGGSGDKGGSDPGRKSFIESVERWYNLMQEIAKLEKVINHEETLRAKLESDLYKNGKAYYKSQKESLSAIQDSIVAQEELNLSRREFFNQRREELNKDNGPFTQLYEFDEQGQLKYKEPTNIRGSSAQNGYAFLADLMKQHDTGKAKYTVEEQYRILEQAGFSEYMKYDSSGNEIKLGGEGEHKQEDYDTYYSSMVQAFWDRVEAQKSEMQTLYDAIAEGENNLLELEQQRNDLLQAMYDNQKELEDSVLSAIEDMRQREIDALQDERDKLEEATGKYIDGLSEALDKERQMYDTQENQNELDTKKRRLGILQRSGASAEDIYSLQKEITESEKNMYFDAQQAQIDAIQQASDLEIERLDTQIQIMQDTLDFQKEMGLLWYKVYEVMGKSSGEITNFVMGNDSQFWAKSPLESKQHYDNTLFSADQWKSFAADQQNISKMLTWNQKAQTAEALSTYSQNMASMHGQDWDASGKYSEVFRQKFQETGDRTKAAVEASKAFEADAEWRRREQEGGAEFIGTSDEKYVDIDDNQHWKYTYRHEMYGGNNPQYMGQTNYYFVSKVKENHNWVNGVCSKCGHQQPPNSRGGGGWSPNNCSDNCSGVCKGQLSGGTSCSKNCANNCSGGCKTGCQGTCTNSCKGGPNDKVGGYTPKKKKGSAAGINNHPSFAKGNRTLIGELGPELVVSNGQYRIAGQSGAEFVNLPDDAIVFNHMQTRSLLRNGRAGRGKSVLSDARSIASSDTNQVVEWKNSLLSKKVSHPASFAKAALDKISATWNSLTTNAQTQSTGNIIIENATVNMNVQKIANDYDAKRAGEQALNEMLRIANKTSAANNIRR